jgi:phage protein D
MDYDVLINGKSVKDFLQKIEINDRQGAKSDDIRFSTLNNTDLDIVRGGAVEVSFGGFRSGKTNIDIISGNSITALVGAISAPLGVKNKRTRHWLKVRLFDIVDDIAVNCGLSVLYQGVENHFYENVTQFKETDLSFLDRLCQREGYSLKIDNNRLVIYSKAVLENKKAVKTIGFNDVIENKVAFSENPNKIRSVTVKYYAERLISYTATTGDTYGEDITITEYVSDGAEAERFAKGYLKARTENDITVDIYIPITDEISAGNCVEIVDFARWNGKYFINECSYDPENERMRIRGRKLK